MPENKKENNKIKKHSGSASRFLIIGIGFILLLTAVSIFYLRVQTNGTMKLEQEYSQYDKHYVMITNDDSEYFWQSVYEGASEEGEKTNTYIERLGKMITEFLPALQRKFSSNAPVESFEEYLRIDVSMAFIRDFLDRLEKMESTSELTTSDRRFIELIDKLALDKPMSEAELQEFDELVKQRFGKSLLLIGSQRLFALWTNEEETCKQNVNQQRTEISRAEIYFKELESRAKYNLPMTDEEKAKYEELKGHITKTRNEYENSKKYLTNIRLMTGVAEGLLQQAEADNAGQVIREQERKRADKAGAILVNMERTLDESETSAELPLSEEEKAVLNQYVDLHMPAAIKRQKQHAQEFVEVSV